jgi:8-oxo-dGTP pyrophosphatase MutT (NUDIX family)
MVAGSILPVALHRNRLYFLFGKENPLESSAKGWSDFGGGCEKGETPLTTAIREGAEELTGFLGTRKTIKKRIDRYGYYPLTVGTYHIHVIPVSYDSDLPFYYNENHELLWEKLNHAFLKKTMLFEKIEIQWFSIAQMKKKVKSFRSFYQLFVPIIAANEQKIREKLFRSRSRKTMKSNIV